MAKLGIKNKTKSLAELDLAIKRLGDTRVGLYREAVAKVFRRILLQTPQFSGEAVGSWVIGVNGREASPEGMGSPGLKQMRRMAGELHPLQRGSRYWIDVAWRREKPKIDRLRRADKVFITNTVFGDGGELYLELLQDEAYWSKRLRDVNKPYETVADSVAFVTAQYRGKRVNPFKWMPGAEVLE